MTQYILAPTSAEALKKSADYWARVLGPEAKPAPENGTAYLWPVMTNPDTDESMLVVDDASYEQVYSKLTTAEKTVLDAQLVSEDDPEVQTILDAQPKPPTPS